MLYSYERSVYRIIKSAVTMITKATHNQACRTWSEAFEGIKTQSPWLISTIFCFSGGPVILSGETQAE